MRPSGDGPGVSRRQAAGIAASIALVTTGVVLFVLANAAKDDRVVAAVSHALLVAVPAGLGLAVLLRSPGDRFARLLLGAGLLWSLTALAESDRALLYSTGRLAGWLADVALVALLLSFPSGRLAGRAERRVAAAMVALAALLFLPTALLVEQFPLPTAFTSCVSDCPSNAFDLAPGTPAFVEDVVIPAREVLIVAVYLAVVVLLERRRRAAGRLRRLVLAPVLATAAFRAVALAVYFVARARGPVGDGLDVLRAIYTLSLPLIAVGFAAGIVARRVAVAGALRDLAMRLGTTTGTRDLQAALRDVLEDGSVEVVVARLPAATDARAVEAVRLDGTLLGAIVHDARLAQDPALLDASAAYSAVVLENTKLVERLQASVQELAESRSRLVAVADESRRQIERDLHDGAQQRLTGVRIRLAMEAERLENTSMPAAQEVARIGEDVEETIRQIRSLAHGIHPTLLTERGLPDALRAVAREAPLPTVVRAESVPRYAPEVESAVYFVVLEALQNAIKHAAGASQVVIAVVAGDDLAFEVSDDGAGFEAAANGDGHGFVNLQDRVRAVGGRVEVSSAPGRGTRVAGAVPARPA